MSKKQFKTESKRLLDLMINSVYTNKEIFLRELLSNASDALDKLYFKTLTDNSDIKRGDLEIRIAADKTARTLTISDNGIGMTKEELESNLGTIAKSGTLAFKNANELDKDDMDVIGQFGVGFYSAFMVSKKITVLSRAYGSDEAWQWESEGLDGYTVEPAQKDSYGTVITLYLKDNTDDERYDSYLETYTIRELVRKYSDYIRYPIRMLVETQREKTHECTCNHDAEGECTCEHDHDDECTCEHDSEGECSCGHEHDEPEYETVEEDQTLNSMVPLWRRNKSELTDEDYNSFYMDKFHDYEAPLLHIHTNAEGTLSYNSILFVPAQAPYNLYSKSYKRGLQLYSNGVMIMDSCEQLLPEYFGFVKGLVDSADISLNISREMLQQNRQLRAIANGLKKKIKSELEKLLKDKREDYEKFFKAFGLSLKYGIYESYGMEAEFLKDLLLYHSAKQDKLITLREYVDTLCENQTEIYYACGESIEAIRTLPQYKYLIDKGFDVLLMTENVDEFMVKMMNGYDGKPFKSITDNDIHAATEDEKKAMEEKQEENKDLLDAIKAALGDSVKEVRLSARLADAPAGLTSEGPLSLEMEKVLSAMPLGGETKAERILELNPDHPVFDALKRAMQAGGEDLAVYSKLVYNQALLAAGLKIDNPAEFTDCITKILTK